jgi:biofilm protein TabA
MIVTTINRLASYSEIPYAEDIIKFVSEFRASEMKPGRYDIHGDDLFASVSRYDTEPENERKFENHKKYIDLQIVLDGSEKLHWAPVETLNQVEESFSEGGDMALYQGQSLGCIVLGGEQCVVLLKMTLISRM